MKTGMNLLLWTDQVTEAQDVIVDQIKVLGFDAAELPVFATSDLAPYQRLGKRLKSLGLGATAVTVMGQETIRSPPTARSATRPWPFEPPHAYRERMRSLSDWQKAERREPEH